LAKIVDLTIVLGPAFLVANVDETTAGVIIIFGWLMYNWFMVAIWGATVGKRMVGAVVVDNYGRRCGWGRAFGRALLARLSQPRACEGCKRLQIKVAF